MNLKISKHPKIVRFVSIMSSKIMTYLLICHKSAFFMFHFCTFEINEDPLITIVLKTCQVAPSFSCFRVEWLTARRNHFHASNFFLTSKKLVLGTTSNFRQGLLQNKFIIYSLLDVFRCYVHFENGSIRKSVTSKMFHCGNKGLSGLS